MLYSYAESGYKWDAWNKQKGKTADAAMEVCDWTRGLRRPSVFGREECRPGEILERDGGRFFPCYDPGAVFRGNGGVVTRLPGSWRRLLPFLL